MIQGIDILILQYLNSWVGVSASLDQALIFSAKYILALMVAATFAVPALPLFMGRRKNLARESVVLVAAALSGAIARFLVTGLIRSLYFRPRPFEAVSGMWQLVDQVNIAFSVEKVASFPSGHASFTFALAGFMAVYYPKLGGVFFALALFNGISRVAVGAHWPSDIIGGALVGVITAWFINMGFKKWYAKNR